MQLGALAALLASAGSRIVMMDDGGGRKGRQRGEWSMGNWDLEFDHCIRWTHWSVQAIWMELQQVRPRNVTEMGMLVMVRMMVRMTMM